MGSHEEYDALPSSDNCDLISQSDGESLTIQIKSIHKFITPRRLVACIACLKVLGKPSRRIESEEH